MLYETMLSINSVCYKVCPPIPKPRRLIRAVKYLGLLYMRYGLDRFILIKVVILVDNLILVLHYYWVRDDSTFNDER